MQHALTRADAALGDRLEQFVRAHHRRRLTRTGHGDVLAAPAGGWANASVPPRSGNEVEMLVDGATALPRIAEAIESARSSIWLAGWYFSPDFRLRHDRAQTLRELLREAAERVEVRVLGWAGAPLPLFHPDRGEAREMRDELVRSTRIRMGLDAKERPFHCHHEKLVVVDDELAFVGGIDLTSYCGDRFDTSDHPARDSVGWHDAAVRIRGPAVADVADHIRLRWAEVTHEVVAPAVPTPAAGSIELQIVRTAPEHVYRRVPRGEFSVLESYLRALRAADRFVYLENQFLWSPEIVQVLAAKLSDPPSDRFRVLVVLPAKPNNGNDDTRGQLGVLAEADAHADRFLACALYRRDGRPVYVHAKVGIVDDEWLTLGSANLNEHSLFNDTEVNVVTHDAELARATRLRLWSEHLKRPADELESRDPTDIYDELWRPTAKRELERLRAGEPLTHRLVRLPHVSRRTEALRGPLSGILVDG